MILFEFMFQFQYIDFLLILHSRFTITLNGSYTTAYSIVVCERIVMRFHKLIYVNGTLGIHLVRSKYADIRR